MILLSVVLLVILLIVSVISQRLLVYAFIVGYFWFYDYWWYTETPIIDIGVNIYLSDIFTIVALLSTIIITLKERDHIAFHSDFGAALVLFISWIVICVIRGLPTWTMSAVGESRFLMSSLIYFPIVYSIRNMEQFEKILKFISILIISYIIYLQTWRFFVQYGEDFSAMFQSRLMGADTALNVVCLFLFCLVFLLDGSLGHLRNRFLILGLFCVALIPFGARTSWVALAGSTLLAFFLTIKKFTFKKYIVFISIVVLFIGYLFYSGLLSPGGIMDLESETGLGFLKADKRLEGTSSWRLMGWEALLTKYISESPILGDGFGAYFDLFAMEFKGVPPHNDWLLIFAKMGLLGLSLFFSLVFFFYRSGFNFINEARSALDISYMKALLCIFLAGLIGGLFFFFFPFMWIALGLQTALINITPRQPATQY